MQRNGDLHGRKIVLFLQISEQDITAWTQGVSGVGHRSRNSLDRRFDSS